MKLSKPTLHFILFLLLIALMWSLGGALHIDLMKVREWLSHYPIWFSGSLYVLIYVGLTAFLWIGTIDFFRISGALLFGPYWSTLFVFIAETANASILFLLSRKLGREFVEEKFHLKKDDRTYSPDNAGFWTALILRVNPLVPFRFMDLGFGLTKLPFQKYFWAVVLGSPLRIFWLQYVIAGMGELVFKNPMAMFQYFQEHPAVYAFNAIYLFVVIAVTLGAFIGTIIKRNALVRQLTQTKRVATHKV